MPSLKSCICMNWKNSNGFLMREVTDKRKRCSEYVFLKDFLKDCLTVIMLDLEKQ